MNFQESFVKAQIDSFKTGKIDKKHAFDLIMTKFKLSWLTTNSIWNKLYEHDTQRP